MSDDLYARLNVARDADAETIKKAYRKMAVSHHPDKGGNEEEFKKIQEAYAVLSDEQKRAMYDQTGSIDGEGFEGGMPGGMPFDIGSLFGMFGGAGPFGGGNPFGGGGGGMPRGRKMRRPKGPVKVTEVPISLYDFYHGKEIQVKLDRQQFCEGCKGEGFTSFSNCSQCQGSGVMNRMAMMGPGMMVQMQGPCEGCQGEGKKGTGQCSVCSGKKFKTQERVLHVKIEKGMRQGDVLVFEKACSDDPQFDQPGDVHFVLQEADEDIEWKRDGNNLRSKVSISLRESLLGCKKYIDNHPGFMPGFEVEIPSGTQNGEILTLKGKGMPLRGSKGDFGDAFVTVNVNASAKEKEVLEKNKIIVESLFA
jgi:DnaJ family protein A protein 2